MLKKSFLFMGREGFDAQKYLNVQSAAIIDRASKFDKLYLEFGGKLLYDYHAARVLPGYPLDAKMQVIRELAKKREVEFLFCVSAQDLESGKRMGALGISYWDFSLKMLESIKDYGFSVPSVAINLFSGEQSAIEFGSFLKRQGYNVYYRELIKGYPKNINAIASPKGYGKKPFIKTAKPIVIVTGAGPKSGKMATCLAMVYQDYLQGRDSGYAKFESFPIWEFKLSSPINVAYEAATADISDYNVIDPYHLKAYGKKAVNYNRDVESFAIIQKLLHKIISPSSFMRNYKSPTDMGINMLARGISDLGLCEKAARQEIIRRYFAYKNDFLSGKGTNGPVERIEQLMKKHRISISERPVVARAREAALHAKGYGGLKAGCALLLNSGEIVAGGNSNRMHAESAAIINALKRLSGIPQGKDILVSADIDQISRLRNDIYGEQSENLNITEILIVLAISARANPHAARAFSKLPELHSCELHATHMLSPDDMSALRALGINYTSDGKMEVGRMYVG